MDEGDVLIGTPLSDCTLDTAQAPMSAEQALDHVLQTNPVFAVTTAQIRRVTYRVFANTPPHIPALLAKSRAAHADGAAEYLVFEDERWSYDAFLAENYRIAHVLRNRFAIGPGDRVGIAMRNYPELLFLIGAISSLGAVVVFLNAWWTRDELDYALSDSGAGIVFADGERVERLLPLQDARRITIIGVRNGEAGAPFALSQLAAQEPNITPPQVDIDTDDDFAIMYSSGTTGRPKGVVQTHRGAVNAVFSWLIQAVMKPLIYPPAPDAPPPLRPGILIATPLFHVTATHPSFLLSLPAGAKVAVMRKWEAPKAVNIICREQITRVIGVPTQTADLITAAQDAGERLECLEYLGSGGAKRPPSQVQELAEAFTPEIIATGWGMTETNAIGIGFWGNDYLKRPGAAGKLYPPVQELRFLDDAGVEVGQGELGEITIKSPCNMRCYLNKPEATDDVMQEGWLRTGDLGFIDEEGFITIVDRKKDIIIRGGENIACLDVEAALHKHPAIAEACAFAVPDPRLGEVPGAAVQLRAGHVALVADIKSYLSEHIAHFKIPEHIWIEERPLMRGATDKIDRRGIRAACLEQYEI